MGPRIGGRTMVATTTQDADLMPSRRPPRHTPSWWGGGQIPRWGGGQTVSDLVRISLGFASLILAIDLDPHVLQRATGGTRKRVHHVVTYRDERRWRFSVDR